MSEFKVPVLRVEKVEDHPNADRLSLNYIKGFVAISNKHEDDSHRYKEGDLVVYITDASVIPEWLLRKLNMWNDEKEKGMLAGTKGNRVKPTKIHGILSEGILYPVYDEGDHGAKKIDVDGGNTQYVSENEDVSGKLGIGTEYN